MSTYSAEKTGLDFDMEYKPHEASASTPELYIDPVAQKKLLRKLDLWIAPVMTIVFLSAYLDRSNIGNAASAGMVKDLGMTDGQLGSEFRDKAFSCDILTFLRCCDALLCQLRGSRNSLLSRSQKVPPQ